MVGILVYTSIITVIYFLIFRSIDPKKGLKKVYDGDVLGGLLDGLNFVSDSIDTKEQSEINDSEDENHEYDNKDNEDDELTSESDGSDSEYPEGEKENPYVAPISGDNNKEEGVSGKYIPPALRKKILSQNDSESKEMVELKRAIKGPLNKLSEPTMGNCINDIIQIYNDRSITKLENAA